MNNQAFFISKKQVKQYGVDRACFTGSSHNLSYTVFQYIAHPDFHTRYISISLNKKGKVVE